MGHNDLVIESVLLKIAVKKEIKLEQLKLKNWLKLFESQVYGKAMICTYLVNFWDLKDSNYVYTAIDFDDDMCHR